MKMSEAISDPYAYTRLTDCVVQQILMSSDPNLQEVSSLLIAGHVTNLFLFFLSIPVSRSASQNRKA